MGVFIGEGSSLRIPAGGLQIRISDSGEITSSITVELSLDVWPLWLDVAMNHAAEAVFKREELVATVGHDDQISPLLAGECQAGLVAISGAAFALDAFYASIRQYVDEIAALDAVWKDGGTARHARVSETLRRSFRVNNDQAKRLHESVRTLFRFRDWAVHPPAEFRSPIRHDILGSGVEWRFVAFSSPNAKNAVWTAADIIHHCVTSPRPERASLAKWCENAKQRMQERWDRAKAEFLPTEL